MKDEDIQKWEGQPYEAIDLQLIIEFLENFHEDLDANMEMLQDLIERSPDHREGYFDYAMKYMNAARKAIDNAHIDLVNTNFKIFGQMDYKWEADDGKTSKEN